MQAIKMQADELIIAYHNGADFDSVIYPLMTLFPEVATAYMDSDLDADELISLAITSKIALR